MHDVMAGAAVELLQARSVEVSNRDNVIFSSPEGSWEHPSPTLPEETELETLKSDVAEFEKKERGERASAIEASLGWGSGAPPGSYSRPRSGSAERRRDTLGSSSGYEGETGQAWAIVHQEETMNL
jgi:hypothetical protein